MCRMTGGWGPFGDAHRSSWPSTARPERCASRPALCEQNGQQSSPNNGMQPHEHPILCVEGNQRPDEGPPGNGAGAKQRFERSALRQLSEFPTKSHLQGIVSMNIELIFKMIKEKRKRQKGDFWVTTEGDSKGHTFDQSKQLLQSTASSMRH